jgi:hypothetical protein
MKDGVTASEILRLIGIVFLINAAFAVFLYFWASDDDFNGIAPQKDSTWGERLIAFFYFGVTTFATTGYGDITPKSRRARLATSFFMIAMVTGTLSFLFDF